MKALPPEEQSSLFKRLKTVRGVAKNGNYASVYGAGAPKIAKTAGISLDEAQKLHKAYWQKNWSVKAFASAQKTKEIRGQLWVYNPVSRFWYSLRNTKDIFSTINQSTGVFCFDTWLAVCRRDRPQLTGTFHDEQILVVKKGYREEVTAWLKETIEETNNILQLNRRLDIDIQFGDRYSHIH